MKFTPQSPLAVLCLFFSIVTLISCSKDSDLLADYVALDPEIGTIAKFVANDTYQVFISNNPEDDTFEIIVNSESGGTDNVESSGTTVDDSYQTSTSASIVLNVLANDTFEKKEEVLISETSQPDSGDVVINADNTLTYSPFTVEATEETFTYTTEFVKEDGTVGKETGTVTVTINIPQDDKSGTLKAFPSAYGGGAEVTGGRGKALGIVTSLDIDEPVEYFAPGIANNDEEFYTGGFKELITNPNVGYIVFNVSGNIDIGNGGTPNWSGVTASGLGVNNVYDKTVFGQSAPRGGITFWGGTFRFGGATESVYNLIFRYFRVRPIRDRNGAIQTTYFDDAYTWAMLFTACDGLIVDHISGSYAHDKVFGSFTREAHAISQVDWNRDHTWSRNIAGDGGTGIFTSVNPNRTGNPEEYVDDISWLGNLTVSVNRAPNMAFDGDGEVINNIIYDTPNKNSKVYHLLNLNHIGNYYKRTNSSPSWISEGSESSKVPQVYTALNYYESGSIGGRNATLTGSGSEDNTLLWTLSNKSTPAGAKYFTSTQHPDFASYPWPIMAAEEAYQSIVNDGDVGAYKYLDDDGNVKEYRDPLDTEYLNKVRNNVNSTPWDVSNWVLPTIPSNQRLADYDTDNDGMADDWEIRVFGNLDESYGGDFDNDGFENIEEYMNQVDFD